MHLKITRLLNYAIIASISIITTSCFTGVESTKKISDKDVSKSESSTKLNSTSVIDSLRTAPLSQWSSGKKFYVTDKEFSLLLIPEDINPDTLDLTGKIIKFTEFTYENRQGTGDKVIINFTTPAGEKIKYNTGHDKRELSDNATVFNVPFAIDYSMIERADSLISGQNFYINSAQWVDESGAAINGIKYEPITILSVMPGNKVYSFKIKFSSASVPEAYIYTSTLFNYVPTRLFSSIFSIDNPHKLYPQVSDEVWALIKVGKIKQGMTKDECRLSLGYPSDLSKRATYSGIQEYWVYANGVYLVFLDGLLESYKR